MESCSTAFYIKRHKKHSEELTTVCAELTNPDSSLGPTLKTWPLLSEDDFWRHHICQAMSRLSDSWSLHPSSTRTSSPNVFFLTIWDMRNECHWTHSPPTSKRHCSFLAITCYFFKWAEAIPLKEIKTSDMIKFFKHLVIYRFGVPRRIIHNNGSQFVSQAFQRSCNKFRIQSVSLTA